MPVPTIYDFQSAQVVALQSLADLYVNNQILTQGSLNTVLSLVTGEMKGNQTFQQVQIASGVLTVEPSAKINYIELDVEGGTMGPPLDDLDTIAAIGQRGLLAGDIYVFQSKSIGRRPRITGAGNIRVKGGVFTFIDFDYSLLCVVDKALNLIEVGRYPNVDASGQAWPSDTAYIVSNTIYATERIVKVKALSAETLAQGQTVIDTATGSVGEVSVWVDSGFGSYIIGTYAYTESTTTTAVALGLAASINAGPLWTATTGAADEVIYTAPIGSGAGANAWFSGSMVSGGITSTDTNIGALVAGADGTETNGTIDTINGLEDGPLYLKNDMASATVTLTNADNIEGSTLPIVIAAGDVQHLLKLGTKLIAVV